MLRLGLKDTRTLHTIRPAPFAIFDISECMTGRHHFIPA